MQKHRSSQSGIFSPRALVALALCSVGLLLTALGFASTPTPAGWSIVTSPDTSSTQYNFLDGVTCASASNCWAVGYFDNVSGYAQTLIEQWNGTSWTIVTSPNTTTVTGATQSNVLYGVTCVSASNCWAVGESSDATTGIARTLIEQWNGTSWSIVTSPNSSAAENNYLEAVTCVSASNCWAVGNSYSGSGVTNQTLIEQWNGTSWSVVTSLNTSTTQPNWLSGVTCASASECWAVGYSSTGTDINMVYQTLIEQWDGTSWAIVPSPNTSTTEFNFLFGVTCASASECWAVGYGSDDNGYDRTLVEQWNGSAWAIVTSPNTSSTQNNFLESVTCVWQSDCWAAGFSSSTGGVDQTLIEHWDGSAWALVTSPNTSATQLNVFYGATCASGSECWGVGWYINASGDYQTLIEEYSPTIPPLTGVVSQFTHGSAGTFDVDLPLTGNPGIECRSSGSLGAGNYTVVFTFVNNVTSCGTAGTTGGSVSAGPNTNQCTENLTGVANQQYITVTLNDVLDSQNNSGNVSASMGVLIGDTNGDGFVNSADISQTKSQSGNTVTNANFREDANADGFINSADISLVKSQSGTALP